jgi:hypothetical protein
LQLRHDRHVVHGGNQRSIPHGPRKAHQHPPLLLPPCRQHRPGQRLHMLWRLLWDQATAGQVLPLWKMLLAGVCCHAKQAALQGALQAAWLYRNRIASAFRVEGLSWGKTGDLLQQVCQFN